MRAKVLGTQNVSFLNSSGTEIKGVNAFVAFKDENVTGLRTEKFFIKESIPFSAHVEDTVEINFNFKGKIEGINIVK